MQKSWIEDFEQKYNKPTINPITVGFSGIDPTPKSVSAENLDEEILNRLKEIEIRIDSGNIEPDKPEPTTEPARLEPSEIDHEKLGNLLGGNENGHYHLTADERIKLQNIPATGIKGDRGEKGDKGDPGEKGEKGDPGNAGIVNHEELDGLLGGSVNNGHYHIEEAQHHKLDILIKALFPTGTDDIYVPYIDDRDPDNPKVLPYTPFVDLPKGTPPEWEMRALPSGFVVERRVWPMYYGKFPHETYNDGLFVRLQETTGDQNYYLVHTSDLNSWHNVMEYETQYRGIIRIEDGYIGANTKNDVIYTTNYQANIYYGHNTYSNEFISWRNGHTIYVCSAVVSPELGMLLIAGIDRYSNSSGSIISQGVFIRKLKGTNLSINSYSYKNVSSFTPTQCCLAWSPDAKVFCAAGQEGTATSADGENWAIHTDAPKNLTNLTYRQDLGCFFAYNIADYLFYASGDGAEWQPVTNTPIPLESVSAINYNPETGIYCAVGGKKINWAGRYAYFSRDLNTWIPTTITNGAEIEAGDVIYMPSTGLYVLMPLSGSYYYTFDPSEWID